LNVLELLKEKGFEPKKAASTKGGEYHSPCPGCGGVDRFHVWPDQNSGEGSFWCRQCEKGGDGIAFLMEFEGLTYPQVCEKLDKNPKKQMYKTPKAPRSQKNHVKKDWQPADLQNPPDLWVEKATLFVTWAHENLLKNKSKRRWLLVRGIQKDMLVKYQLGWNPGREGRDIWRPRESWGLETVLKDNGQKLRLWIPQGLVIPHISNGIVQRIRIRRDGKKPPRYYVIPGSSMQQMVINPGHQVLLVVESELDLIMIDQLGDVPAVLALGSSSVKPDRKTADILKDKAVILDALDYDDSGIKSSQWWEENYPQHKHWPVPAGKDPGEAFQAGVDIRAWLRAGHPQCWSYGQSSLGKIKRGAPKVESDDIQAELRELGELLQKYPVSIYATPARITLRENQTWALKNWEASKRISELVYLTPGLMEYLVEHPNNVISGDNIILP